MTPLYWSWLLTIVGGIGFWVTGSGNPFGWRINLANQMLWAIYAVHTKQYGFLASVAMYTVVFGRNLWRAEHSR